MHRLSSSFVLAFHGCDKSVGDRLVNGEPFKASDNEFDWLGPGIYFWENNWQRGLEFATEHMKRKGSKITVPFVVGAVIDLGSCLDLTTKVSVDSCALRMKPSSKTSCNRAHRRRSTQRTASGTTWTAPS